MAIQWFPGHMHLTRQAISERLRSIDVVIEMLDARLPASSANPMLAQMTQSTQKPVLKILNKYDLADPNRTSKWLDYYKNQSQTQAISLNAGLKPSAKILIDICQAFAPNRLKMSKPLRVLICGIPNVGKSTLINTLIGRKIAKAADEAGVTRQENRYVLQDGFYLFDTPGILWPRIIVAESGYNLASSGAIGRNAFDDITVAIELLSYLKNNYPLELEKRYEINRFLDDEDLLHINSIQASNHLNDFKINRLDNLNNLDNVDNFNISNHLDQSNHLNSLGQPHTDNWLPSDFELYEKISKTPDEILLNAIGYRRGALLSGGKINTQKSSELLIHDFRSGILGNITLETPEQFEQWLKVGRKLDAERIARKEALREQGFIRAQPFNPKNKKS